jgi:Predicted NTP binding protein (contains STAS domain)
MEREESGRLKVLGVLSFDTVPALWKQARSLFNKNESPSLCIDLGGVTRCDSAGLALLIEWTRSARRARKAIVFMNVPEQMLSLARVSSLEDILPLARQ